MKAIRLYGPGDFRLDELPRPVPGPGEVLLQVLTVAFVGQAFTIFWTGESETTRLQSPL